MIQIYALPKFSLSCMRIYYLSFFDGQRISLEEFSRGNKGTREIILSFMRYTPYEGEGKRYGRLLSETSQCPVTYEWKVGKSRMRVVNANRSSFLRFDAHTGHAPHTPTNFVIFLPRGNYRLTKRSCGDKKTPMFSAPPLIKTQSSPVSPVESMR